MSGDLNMFSSCFDYRITILGEPQVGKTCILNQLVCKRFNHDYVPTLETDMEYLHEYKGTTYMCLIVDTAGVREFPAMRRLSISRSNGFMIVFDLSNEKTFKKAKASVREVLSHKENQPINIVMVGNKRDLVQQQQKTTTTTNNQQQQQQQRLQREEDLAEMARDLCTELEQQNSYIYCEFFEVSAFNNTEITNMFEKLLDLYDIQSRCGSSSSVTFRKLSSSQQRRRTSRFSVNLDSPSSSAQHQKHVVKQKRYSLPKGFFPSSFSSSSSSSSSSSINKKKSMSMLSLPESIN